MYQVRPRGILATLEGRKKLIEAKSNKRNEENKSWTYAKIADVAGLDEKTVKRFFYGNKVDKNSAFAIAHALELQLEEVVDFEEKELPLEVYIERPPFESVCYQAIEKKGMIIRIKGPEKMGKSMLMEKIFQKAEEKKYRRVLLHFGEPTNEVISSYDKFLLWFCKRITEELGFLDTDAEQYWETVKKDDNNIKCRKYFTNNILSKIDEISALVLGLHSIDRIFPCYFAEDFFGMLRSWHGSKGIWGKLRLILAHSTEVYVEMNVNKSPFNVGEPVTLDEFNHEQLKQLAVQYAINLDDLQVTNLMSQIGGHPYLVDKAITYIKSNPKYDENDFVNQAISLESLKKICKNYLDQLWNQLFNEPSEISKAMLQALKDLVEGKQLSEVDDKKVLFLLDSMGFVIKQENGQKTIRNNLYREYLKNKFFP